jgi:hypothetical protein
VHDAAAAEAGAVDGADDCCDDQGADDLSEAENEVHNPIAETGTPQGGAGAVCAAAHCNLHDTACLSHVLGSKSNFAL